jgi:hypothetical protein
MRPEIVGVALEISVPVGTGGSVHDANFGVARFGKCVVVGQNHQARGVGA